MSPITAEHITRAISSREECSKVVSELLTENDGHSNLVALVFALAQQCAFWKKP